MRRRDFLRTAAAATASLPILRAASADEKKTLRIGLIGVGSRGTGLMRLLLKLPGIEVPAVCDIDARNLGRAQDIAEQAGGKRPAGYSKNEHDYRRLLDRQDLDGVLIATPVELHAPMAIDAMKAQKPVACEVVAAKTIDDCWELVRTHEKTGVPYMTLENYVFRRPTMMVQNMVEKGVFGELTSAECGYIHEIPFSLLYRDNKLTWRGRSRLGPSGNHYATHSLGPVCGWLGINRGDRLVRLVSMSSQPAARAAETKRRFPEDHPLRKIQWTKGDNNMTLIQTALGRLITLRYDTESPRPHNMTHYALQGTAASYHSTSERLYVVGRSPAGRWEPLSKYREEYDHPYWAWKTRAEEIEKRRDPGVDGVTAATLRAWGTGHGGGDFLELWLWVKSLRDDTPPPLGVHDAVTWASVQPLSIASVASGGAPVEIPDFTRGRWKAGA